MHQSYLLREIDLRIVRVFHAYSRHQCLLEVPLSEFPESWTGQRTPLETRSSLVRRASLPARQLGVLRPITRLEQATFIPRVSRSPPFSDLRVGVHCHSSL